MERLLERLEVWLLCRRAERVLHQVNRELLRQRTREMQEVVREARQLGLAA